MTVDSLIQFSLILGIIVLVSITMEPYKQTLLLGCFVIGIIKFSKEHKLGNTTNGK